MESAIILVLPLFHKKVVLKFNCQKMRLIN